MLDQSTFTFTCMHLADAFIQIDLQYIQAIFFFYQYVKKKIKISVVMAYTHIRSRASQYADWKCLAYCNWVELEWEKKNFAYEVFVSFNFF